MLSGDRNHSPRIRRQEVGFSLSESNEPVIHPLLNRKKKACLNLRLLLYMRTILRADRAIGQLCLLTVSGASTRATWISGGITGARCVWADP